MFVTDIVPDNQVQMALLDTVDREKHRKLMVAIDDLTDRFGRERVKVATQGVDNQWLLRSDMVSKCYTTRLSDIQTVHVL
ncbi:DUF4113 domain-containing protein [Pontibacter rufus]|uniref:DUF4113 domain-containing protein n=1 Tax=Pontibacter rufus TaxID=2791028 RepID=UPI00351C939F